MVLACHEINESGLAVLMIKQVPFPANQATVGTPGSSGHVGASSSSV